jgi:hypothetical protein
VLRNIFGAKCEEGTGDQRHLHNEEFLDFCSTLNIIQVIKSRRIRQVGHLTCTRERRDTYRVLVGKPEETAWRAYDRQEDNIKVDLKEIG